MKLIMAFQKSEMAEEYQDLDIPNHPMIPIILIVVIMELMEYQLFAQALRHYL